MRFIGFGKIHLSTFYPIFATISCITREYSLVMLTDNTDNYPVLFLEFLIFPSEMSLKSFHSASPYLTASAQVQSPFNFQE